MQNDAEMRAQAKVASLMYSAGSMFTEFGHMIMQMHGELSKESEDNMRWSLEDVQRLQEAFDTFANEVRSVVANVEKRTAEQMSDDLKRAVVLRKGLGDLTVARGRPLKAVDVGERSSSTKKARRTDEESIRQRYTVTDEQPLAFARRTQQPHAIVDTMQSTSRTVIDSFDDENIDVA